MAAPPARPFGPRGRPPPVTAATSDAAARVLQSRLDPLHIGTKQVCQVHFWVRESRAVTRITKPRDLVGRRFPATRDRVSDPAGLGAVREPTGWFSARAFPRDPDPLAAGGLPGFGGRQISTATRWSCAPSGVWPGS
jgi:hypothetical protein